MPTYGTPGSAGLDLRACMESSLVLGPGEQLHVPTGLAIHIDDPRYMAVAASRSGLARKHRVYVAQGAGGIIDSDYQGEIGILLENRGKDSFEIKPGDRIAQLLLVPVLQMQLEMVDSFEVVTERAQGGFGSTGTR